MSKCLSTVGLYVRLMLYLVINKPEGTIEWEVNKGIRSTRRLTKDEIERGDVERGLRDQGVEL